ncbi:hypothetical protein MTYP_01607 [Methylophilaceae bacterium]|nr:hypothetical protein MTYP_01607 [Methylophilaceae bacterium]
MQKWSYLIFKRWANLNYPHANDANIAEERILNALGSQGWELVSVNNIVKSPDSLIPTFMDGMTLIQYTLRKALT